MKQKVNKRLHTDKWLVNSEDALYAEAKINVVRAEQMREYPEIFNFFTKQNSNVKSVPNLVSQLNLYLDDKNVIRVQGKFKKSTYCPILLPKASPFTKTLIICIHKRMKHAGIYSVISELRREYHVPRVFSVVKKLLRSCVICKRYNAAPIKLNQSEYREFRHSPPQTPFISIFIDYAGPWTVKLKGDNVKVYLLVITCMWSRAVNLQICRSASVEDFLRAMQLHIYKHGIFASCRSDLGSQFTAGCPLIKNFLDDNHTKEWLRQRGINSLKFEQYAKGNSSLGSLVECMVKQTKRLLNKAIGRVHLDYFDFELAVEHTINLINNRPVAFKETLRDGLDLQEVITPALLLRGTPLHTINVIPNLQVKEDTGDPDYQPGAVSNISNNFQKLVDVKRRLQDVYHTEFLAQLTNQAIDKSNRYKKVKHKFINIGDIVLLKDQYIKPIDYCLGIVRSVETNDLEEVTAAYVMKGDTRELVYRHSSSLIPLLSHSSDEVQKNSLIQINNQIDNVKETSKRKRRVAAVTAEQLNKDLLRQSLV